MLRRRDVRVSGRVRVRAEVSTRDFGSSAEECRKKGDGECRRYAITNPRC